METERRKRTDTKYPFKVIDRAIKLYQFRIKGRRVYSTAMIPDILRSEFPGKIGNLSRQTIYFWLDRYCPEYRLERDFDVKRTDEDDE